MAGASVRVTRNFTLDDVELVTREDLRAMGEMALLKIRERTAQGISAEGAPFAPYSPDYAKRKGAYVFGASASATRPNLELTGQMLGAMQIVDIDEANHRVTLGFVR